MPALPNDWAPDLACTTDLYYHTCWRNTNLCWLCATRACWPHTTDLYYRTCWRNTDLCWLCTTGAC